MNPDPRMDAAQAAAVLGVPPDRIQAMVDEGLLHPVDGTGDEQRFDPAEVNALHHLGG